MHKPQEQVRDFHRAMNLRRPDIPEFNWEDLGGIRCDLIVEEYEELRDAIDKKDPLAAIDAVCDLLYVVYGAGVSMGVNVEPFFEEVQRANMEKAGGPKREDGKQLKPADWREPDHDRVFAETYDMDIRTYKAWLRIKDQGRATNA